jgi:transcriptional regulator with XRE-family HTH domain
VPTFDPELATFAAALRTRRHRQGLTLRDLGRDCGRSLGFLSDLENGKREPSAATLERLADVLGVTMDELWRGLGRCDPAARPDQPPAGPPRAGRPRADAPAHPSTLAPITTPAHEDARP